MGTIGAMYSGPQYSQIGLMMHEKLRTSLLNCPMIYQQPKISLQCLQAMLLTQIATLYFGPKSALFVAQQLGGLIVNTLDVWGSLMEDVCRRSKTHNQL